MKKMTKNQVIKAAIKISKNATKSLEKILKDNDMFFDPYDSWKDGAIDHSKDINDNWENVSIRNVRNANDLFFELCDEIKDKDIGYIKDNLKTRQEIEQYIKERQLMCSPVTRIKKLEEEIKRIKEKYNIKD